MKYAEILMLAAKLAGRREDVPDADALAHLRRAHAKALRSVFAGMDEETALQIGTAAVKVVEGGYEIDANIFADMTDQWIRRHTEDMMGEIIRRVISGGQSGVDLAALRAAKTLGVPTGGLMPYGWLTLDGPRPEYATEFGMFECRLKGYPPRTSANVGDSDFTLRIARDFNSSGEKCTLKAIHVHKRPHADIQISPAWTYAAHDVSAAVTAIHDRYTHVGHPIVLNVAGNSEKTAPGIGDTAFDLVREILGRLRA